MVASRTAWGGKKSGSPTHRDVTVSPAASISLTKEKISTVLLGLTAATMGFKDAALSVEAHNLDVVDGLWHLLGLAVQAKDATPCRRNSSKAIREWFILILLLQ
jgi:hypothetical protein